jgi:hypothetical protein
MRAVDTNFERNRIPGRSDYVPQSSLMNGASFAVGFDEAT